MIDHYSLSARCRTRLCASLLSSILGANPQCNSQYPRARVYKAYTSCESRTCTCIYSNIFKYCLLGPELKSAFGSFLCQDSPGRDSVWLSGAPIFRTEILHYLVLPKHHVVLTKHYLVLGQCDTLLGYTRLLQL